MLGENEPDAHCEHTVIALNELYVPPAQGVHASGEDWPGLGWIVHVVFMIVEVEGHSGG